MRHLTPAALIVTICACGAEGDRFTSRATPTAPPEPPRWLLTGSVVDTLGTSGVAGATLTFSGRPVVTTTNDGRWELSGTGTASARLGVTIEAAGYLTRETGVSWTSSGRQDVQLDLIQDRPPFALAYFRELVRNAFEKPEGLERLRRWTSSPNFYVHATNPKTGQPLTPSEIDLIERTIRDTVPQLTGGRFAAGTIEVGFGQRDATAGYIRVIFVHEPDGNYCGQAFVGANPGEITMNYDRCRDACGGFAPETLAHEIGHALGFWHTQSMGGIMNTSRVRRCGNVQFSAAEILHARVAYARPPGNVDPDVDPPAYMSIETEAAPLVICRR